MSLDQIVNVQVTRQTAAITQAGFGTPLILGPNAEFAQTEIRTYTTLAAVAEDFATSDAEYVMANKLFSQTPRPERIKIGKTSVAVAQLVTITPNVVNEFEYSVTIDGTEYTFESDVDAVNTEIVAGLLALINADTGAKVTASGTTTLILTADDAGVPFTYEVGTNLTAVLTNANNGIAEDIQKAIDADNDWYFLLTTATTDAVVEVAAATIEALKKQYLFINADSDVRTSAADDIVSKLQDKSYFRTSVFYTGTIADRGEAGWVGRVAPLDPGSETWAFKTIAGQTVDKWTDAQIEFLKGKNANYYIQVAGINVTQLGKTVGGEYIDIIRFIDWVVARIQERIFRDFALEDKIPFTDGGIAVIEGRIKSVMEDGVTVGGIASSDDYTVTVPKASAVPVNDKANRILTGVKFQFTAAGAIHATNIQGTVTL